MLDDGLGHWFAGFFDGEGTFGIQKTPHGGFTCTAAIVVRDDDSAILEQVSEVTGLGRLTYQPARPGRGDNPTVTWTITRREHARALVDLFDRYPLRAKKARHYAIWREAVLLWTERSWYVGKTGRKNDWSEIAALKEQLHAVRQYAPAIAA